MTNTEQLQALQNSSDGLNLEIHVKHFEDKRKKTVKYFAQHADNKSTVSPVLDYCNMNHFLMGWRNSNFYRTT